MNDDRARVVLLGATGYTGRLIARELVRNTQHFVMAGRSAERLDALATDLGVETERTVVDVTRPADLAGCLTAGDVVINCVGPFSRLGEPVVRACLDAGAHYLDTTGEQSFMRMVYDRYAEPAAERGVAVVPAMAFEYSLGDCAVALAAAGMARPLRSVDTIYAWATTTASRGTRRTIVRVLSRRGVILEHGRLRRRALGSAQRAVRIASGEPTRAVLFTSGEVLTVPRHQEVESVRGWAIVGSARARLLSLFAPAVPFMVTLVRPILEAIAVRKPDPEPEERGATRFTIRVELHDRTGVRRAVELRGRDPYAITAAAAVAGARRVHEAGAPRGVLTPAQLVDPRSFLVALADRGLRVVENA